MWVLIFIFSAFGGINEIPFAVWEAAHERENWELSRAKARGISAAMQRGFYAPEMEKLISKREFRSLPLEDSFELVNRRLDLFLLLQAGCVPFYPLGRPIRTPEAGTVIGVEMRSVTLDVGGSTSKFGNITPNPLLKEGDEVARYRVLGGGGASAKGKPLTLDPRWRKFVRYARCELTLTSCHRAERWCNRGGR